MWLAVRWLTHDPVERTTGRNSGRSISDDGDERFLAACLATIHRNNSGEVSAIADLAAEKGAGRLYIGLMYAPGGATALNDLVVTDELWDAAVAQYAHAIRSGVIAPVDIRWRGLAADYEEGANPVAEQLHLTSRCTRGLRIDPLGNAYVSAKLRQWHPRFWTIGNVVQFGVGTIWRESKLLVELRSYEPGANEFDGVNVHDIATVKTAARPTTTSWASLLSSGTAPDTRGGRAPSHAPTARSHLTDGVVVLERLTPADAPCIALACSGPDTQRWLPLPDPYTVEDALAFIGRQDGSEPRTSSGSSPSGAPGRVRWRARWVCTSRDRES